MDAGLVIGIVVVFLAAAFSFLAGWVVGAGVVVNRVRHFRDWVGDTATGEHRAAMLAVLGNLISWLEGRITIHE